MPQDVAAEIEARLKAVGGWRAETLGKLRRVILATDPGVVEEIKWRKPTNPHGVPTYSHDGLICTAEMYKDKVKFTFAKGSELPPPTGLSWIGGGVRKAIDIKQGEPVDEVEFAKLIRAAVDLNTG